MYSPNTKVKLLNTPLTMDGENQIKFGSVGEQSSYFSSLPQLSLSDFTYQRKDNVIGVPTNFDQLQVYNYVMYQNTQFSSKWFYGFISKMEYVNENCTLIYISTDVWNTWIFDIVMQKSFIERSTDLPHIGNTLADSVPNGQLIEKFSTTYNLQGGYFVFCTTDVTQDVTTDSTPYSFKIGEYSLPCWVLYWSETQAEEMATTMQRISNHGWSDRILSAVYVPIVGDVANLNLVYYTSEAIGTINICTGMDDATALKSTLTFSYSMSSDFKKSLTYPYAKIVVTDMTTGQNIELSPEKFAGSDPQFEIQCTICETPTYRIIPLAYAGQAKAYNQALVTRCNTSLPIANNVYAKYMMMNTEGNTLKMAGATIGSLASVARGDASGALTGVSQILGVVAQENQASKLPNQLTAISDGAMERLVFQNGIKISLMMMDEYHQLMADDFWRMYGYPVRKLDTPTLTGTENFKFLKIISPNITGGNVPQEDMMELQSIFTKGVTIWNGSGPYKLY